MEHVDALLVAEIEEDYEPLQNPEDIASCNNCIPNIDESSDYSDSDGADDDEFYNDEAVEIISDVNDEHNLIQEPPVHLAQPSLPSQRARNNAVNAPSSKFKHVKPSMTSTIVENNKVKTCVLNKNKDKHCKLESKFKSACSSMNNDHIVSNWNALVAEMLNSIFNPTFIQILKSSINRVHSGGNKLKSHEIS